MATTIPSCEVMGCSSAAQASGGAPETVPPGASSPFEQQLADGFSGLRFPDALEQQYARDKADERLKLLRFGLLLVIVLSNSVLLTDWMMVHDRFDMALVLRVLVNTPLALAWYLALPRLRSEQREWVGFMLSLVAACITIYLCLSSQDALAPPYLVCLAIIQLFNSGVFRMRFWMSVRVDAIVLAMFAFAVAALRHPPVGVMASMALVIVSTMVFTLYGSYWLEHEERSNWLMLQHEHSLLDELDQANQRLDQLSRFDPLTGLANRRHFDEFLQQVWTRAQKEGRALCLLMMDIDHFKRYNDHYGHPAGDACLQEVAAALEAHLRAPCDLLARLGGEEFTAVISGASLTEAVQVAQRVKDAVAQLALPHAGAPERRIVTLSIGVACMLANDHASPTKLMTAADEALYRAKAAGRNQVVAAA